MIHIDPTLCKTCGICGDICPRHIPVTVEHDGKKITMISPERSDICVVCGHCAAVCPEGAITVDGLDPNGFSPARPWDINDEQLLNFMTQRRTVRRYKNKPVPREALDRILEAAHIAPPGASRMTTGVIVMDKREVIAEFSKLIYPLYEQLDKMLKNPVGRFIIKRKAGARAVRNLREFLMPGMKWYIRWYREGKSDEITRDAPALMLFHCPISDPAGEENCLIAATYSVFMAQALGVGTCFNGIIPPSCNRGPDIRKFLKLPDDREVHACITLGYPKYKFKRTIPRRLAEVRYIE